jgi:CubicO group peptidase (beta-lactamase class C family)
VEKVAGVSFGEFVTRQIFKPLGMAHSLYEPNSDDPRLAQGYTSFALSKPEPIGPEAHGWIGAVGGIFSTPGDLAKWNLALLNGRLLQPKSYALMITPRTLSNGKTTDYGCGLSVRSQGGRQVLSHNGAVSGFNAWNAMIPSTQSAVIMMANLDGGLRSIPGDLFALLLKDPTTVPMIQGPPAADTTRIILAQMQKGKIDRHLFSDEFNHFLTDKKLVGASKRLKRFGKATGTEVLTLRERGGMEVSVTRLTCKSGNLRSLMYRQPDGRIEQFFVDEDK